MWHRIRIIIPIKYDLAYGAYLAQPRYYREMRLLWSLYAFALCLSLLLPSYSYTYVYVIIAIAR